MGDGVSDLVARGEASEAECEAVVRDNIERGGGVITWWPGGRHHAAICRMKERGEVTLTNVSGSQETKFEVRLAESE
jgi:hypothetical protein